MKRNYFKNTGSLAIAIGLMATTLLSSCLKDNSPGTIDFSKSPSLVAWQYKGFSATPYVAAVLANPGVTYNLEVTLSTPSVTLGSAVTVTAVEDAASLTSYNTAHSTSYTELPAAGYTLPNGGKITIPAGQTTVQFPITFAADQINFLANPALALKLTDANGAQLTSNLNVAIVVVKVKSIYAGTYAVSGERTRFNGSTEASGQLDQFAITGTVPLATYTALTLTGQAGDAGSGYTWALQINADNSVTVLPDPSAAAGGTPTSFKQGDANGPSKFDPATKTFTIHCGYLNGAGALREIDEVLVLQ